MLANPTIQDTLSGVVVVVVADLLRQHQGWGWLRLVAGASAYKDVPGLTMAKVMGSGHGGGFGLRPSPTHQGLIFTFSHLDFARAFLDSDALQAYRHRARECWTGVMVVQSGRGHWDKQAWVASSPESFGRQRCATRTIGGAHPRQHFAHQNDGVLAVRARCAG